MNFALASSEGFGFLLRWLHYFFGIVWIGHLYYFNFTQGPFFAETDAATKSAATQKLVPRALWWFRWGAMFTFVTGLIYLLIKSATLGAAMATSSWGVCILIGAALGTIMWGNVWFVIWPAQKIVIQNAVDTAQGKPANPVAAGRAARALVASRTNTLFSMPMLFFMSAASHLPIQINESSQLCILSITLAAVIGLLELNALKGKTGPMTTVKGVIHCSLALTVVVYAMVEIFC